MFGKKTAQCSRAVLLATLVIFCFGAAGEICGSFFETTAAAFGSGFQDNKPEDIRKVLKEVRQAKVKVGRPENSQGIPVAVMVVEAEPRALVAWDLKSGKELWKITPPISSEITLGDDLVIFQSSNYVAAYNIGTGTQAWSYEIEDGWDYHGADVSEGVAALSIGVGGESVQTYANGRLIALNARTGAQKWDLVSGGGLVGEPIVYGDFIFAPWDRQKLTVIDAEEGEEVCRLRAIDYTINFVEGSPNGIYLGSIATINAPASIFLLDESASTGMREGSTVFRPNLAPVPGDPLFKRDAYAKPVAGRSASEKIRFHWKPASGGKDEIAMSESRYYLHYWRYIIAFDAATSRVRWSFRAPEDIESMSVIQSGIVGVDTKGGIFFVDSRTGKAIWNNDTGYTVLAAAFDADGFRPAGDASGEPNPLAGLKELIWDKDNRMLPIRAYSAFLMAAFPNPEVTRDLLQVYSDASTPKGLRDAVVKALEKRKVGSEYLVEALNMRYDYLENTQGPPMNVVAPSLVNMKEVASVPGLLTQLMNHETPAEHLVHTAVAIRELGDPSVVGTLRQFLTLYHADSSMLGNEKALGVAAEAILKFSDNDESRDFVKAVRDDSQTLPELKVLLRALIDPIAAAKAEAEAKAKAAAEVKAKADQEAAAKAEAEAKAKARPPDSLSREQINRTIAGHQHILKPCVQEALGKAPTLQSIRMRFVITGNTGLSSELRILPNKIPGLEECLMNALRLVQFPVFTNYRQMATYTINIRGGGGAAAPQRAPGARPADPDAFEDDPYKSQPKEQQPQQPTDPDAFQ